MLAILEIFCLANGKVERADADAMTNPAIDIRLVGVLPVLVGLADHAVGSMLVPDDCPTCCA